MFTLAALLALGGCDDSCVTGPISTAGTTEVDQALLDWSPTWNRHAKTCQVGGYTVIGPAESAPGEIYVTRNGTTVWITEQGTIDIRSRDGSLVSVQDMDSTGHFTLVSYDAIDPADGQKYSFTDANADGRLDTKIGDHGGFVNLDGQWLRLEKRGDQPGALVNGEWKPLEKRGKLLFRLRSP
jgi:hypothetical protein